MRAEDLRFTAAEAAALVRSTGVELTTTEVEALTDRTEGWAAALRLAAVSLRGRPDHADLVRRFGASHRYILDYVVEEVLAGLPRESQEFLLRTSILDRLCGSLCEAVTGEADGQTRLEELERANLLIIPLDDERRWYRYHALFAEILRARLRTMHPDEVAGLHARASAWHEERGDDDEAIGHSLLSGDLERTSQIVAVASGRHVNAGELSTVRRWLDALPPEVVRGHAQLSASYAWCLVLAGETEGVAERLADAERALAEGRDGGPTMRLALPTQLALLRSQLAGLEGDSDTAIAQARLARDLVRAGLPAEAEATLHGTAAALLGVALHPCWRSRRRRGSVRGGVARPAGRRQRACGGAHDRRPRRDRHRPRRSRACAPAVRGRARAGLDGIRTIDKPCRVGRHGQGSCRARTGRARRGRRPSRPRARHSCRRCAERAVRPGDAGPNPVAAR